MNQASFDTHSKPSYSCLLGIVVPCFNEELVLPETASRLKDVLVKLIDSGKISADSKIYFIDDGSTDGTWKIIESFVMGDKYFSGIKLSRNQGHQKALLAGIFSAKGDALISIDADLQDDIDVIEGMVDAYLTGNDLVYGIRNDRSTDSLFKRLSAELYYRLLKSMGVDIVFNHADYRLMSRRAIDYLAEYRETNLFLRGIVSLIGCTRMPNPSAFQWHRALGLTDVEDSYPPLCRRLCARTSERARDRAQLERLPAAR